jgi:hypothetical protein
VDGLIIGIKMLKPYLNIYIKNTLSKSPILYAYDRD